MPSLKLCSLLVPFCCCQLALPPGAAGEEAGRIYANCQFDTDAVPAKWYGPYETAIKVTQGGGAFGSKGFLQVGPHTAKWVGAGCRVPFVATDDTWVGFCARKPGGARIHSQIWDSKRRRNVGRKHSLPADGSWAVFLFPTKWLGIEAGTPLKGVSFFHRRNDNRAPIRFDLDNVVIGRGKNLGRPAAVEGVEAAVAQDAVKVSWTAPSSVGGIRKFRIYRGLYSTFPRDDRHLLAQVQRAAYEDRAFAHLGLYFYAVRAVDFAGNEGPDAGAARVNFE